YRAPREFQDLFRRHLIQWLTSRGRHGAGAEGNTRSSDASRRSPSIRVINTAIARAAEDPEVSEDHLQTSRVNFDRWKAIVGLPPEFPQLSPVPSEDL